MTVEELQGRISNQEFIQWKAFYVVRRVEEEKAEEKAKHGR